MKKRRDFFSQHFYDYISQITGKNGVKILENIGDGATDEKILDKSKTLKMAEIRAVLNQLHENGVVDYTREKNLSNGWFTYTWRFNTSRAVQNFMLCKKRECEQLLGDLRGQESALFYKCTKGCSKLAFDSAIEIGFRCPKCNHKLRTHDNATEIREINQRISAIQKLLEYGQQNNNPFNGVKP